MNSTHHQPGKFVTLQISAAILQIAVLLRRPCAQRLIAASMRATHQQSLHNRWPTRNGLTSTTSPLSAPSPPQHLAFLVGVLSLEQVRGAHPPYIHGIGPPNGPQCWYRGQPLRPRCGIRVVSVSAELGGRSGTPSGAASYFPTGNGRCGRTIAFFDLEWPRQGREKSKRHPRVFPNGPPVQY